MNILILRKGKRNEETKKGGGTRACETQNPDPLFVLPAPVIPETLTPEPS